MQPRVYINWGQTRPAIVGVSCWNARERQHQSLNLRVILHWIMVSRRLLQALELWSSAQKSLLPFHFTESGIENTTVVSQGILEYSIPCEDVEEGTVRVEEEWYEKTMLLALDEGDATTTTERALIAQEEDEDVRGTDGMPTRKSTRSRKQVKDNNFVFV